MIREVLFVVSLVVVWESLKGTLLNIFKKGYDLREEEVMDGRWNRIEQERLEYVFPWYYHIGEGVREAVYLLRNVGINTTCSCEEESYIEFDSLDPTAEQWWIYSILSEAGYYNFKIEFYFHYSYAEGGRDQVY